MPRYLTQLILSTLLTGAFVISTPAAHAWTTIDLGIVPTLNGYGPGLNNLGQVAGCVQTPDGLHAFVWSNEAGLQILGALPEARYSCATAINDSGQAVGYNAGYGSTAEGTHAFLWSSATGMQSLGMIPGGADYSRALAINNSGQVTGDGAAAQWPSAFVWSTATGMFDLPVLAGGEFTGSFAAAINDTGQVAGYSGTPTYIHAILWSGSTGTQDLGTLPGDDESHATSINNLGQVVGYSKGQTTRAFIWSRSSGMQDLGGLPDGRFGRSANDINDNGQVIGQLSDGSAFVWARGAYTDPNGRLSSVVHSVAGAALTFTYDLSGRIVEMLDPAGNHYRFGYAGRDLQQ